MRIGVFCTYENHERDFARCFDMQTRYVQHAEALGMDEAWVAEHHFDPDAVSPSILTLLAYLAGVTSRIRLGSAAVLIAFRNPIQVAEDVATIDILSKGRFDFGVAKGGPFALQNKRFLAGGDHSRDMTLEALGLVYRLLYQDHVSFTGEYYQASDVTITPKPLQRPIPTFLATTTPGAIRYAARNDLGVMAAPPYPLSRVLDIIETYREASGPGADPRLTLARFFYAAPTREEALAEAVPFIRRFAERIGGIFCAQAGAPNVPFDEAAIIEHSLIGSFDEIGEKIVELHRRTGLRSLLLKPASLNADKNFRALDDFARLIRPRLPVAEATPKALEAAR
jgi:alkanesulfonate monooxygenase SsuD/methylene tetrahydromethanopterin reductase-like flavin-dependent oxidoreductase (luciferase family)